MSASQFGRAGVPPFGDIPYSAEVVEERAFGVTLSIDTDEKIQVLLQAGDVTGAVMLAKQAYLNNEQSPLTLNLVAHGLESDGDIEGALRVLGESNQLYPEDAMTLTNVGHCLVKLARPTHALEAFNQALRISPNLPRAHHGVGLAFWMREEYEAGDAAQLRAIQLDPNYPDPYGALALAYSQRREFEKSRAYARKALTLNPGEIQALMLETGALYAEGRWADCVARLKELLAAPDLPPLQRAVLSRRLGNSLDKLKAFPEAFEAYRTSKACERRVYRDLFEAEDIETQPQKALGLFRYFSTENPVQGEVHTHSNPLKAQGHVFLMGFPRSGTTLLEQVLASHPEIYALEEKPTLGPPIAHYFQRSSDVGKLMSASEDELQQWRDVYWERVKSHVPELDGKIFIDKQPSLTLYIPLIKRLFPSSKIIFCIRDPRDVVLSCFRHGFTMNANMYEYTDISKLAELYDLTMRCAEIYCNKLNINLYLHKHEEFVTNFEAKTRDLCAFLALDYIEDMKNFVETANNRDINTPSREQVRSGLTTSGIGYWRNYAQNLNAATPSLARWIEAYGYSRD